MTDYTRGDDPIYNGFREGWQRQEAEAYERNRECRANDSDGISTERHAEICQAEKEGRCVVLPCKAGDTVFYAPNAGKRGLDYIGILETTVSGFKYENNKLLLLFGIGYGEAASNFGKTVFPTREAAEAAMGGE